jgi:short-subunit dehydrogenase
MKKSIPAAPHLIKMLAGIAATAAAAALLSRRKSASSLARKIVVITGGSRGLGLALADRFGRSGARLVLAARNVDELESARQMLLDRKAVLSSNDILLVPADLTVPAEAANLIQYAIDHFGQVDILINNAGIIEVGPFENQSLSAFEKAMNTNFFAALHTIQAVLPYMLARHAQGIRKAGAIVNIGSIGGKFAMPHLLPYVASKFALVGFSEGLHAELRHKGIRVTTVNPGLMRTGSHVQARFTGQKEKEFRWFALGATAPLVAASTTHAANKIFNATVSGRAEITITPQAWLAARAVGLAPAATQILASYVNEYLLPAPSASQTGEESHPTPGLALEHAAAPLTPAATGLRARHNQPTS